MAELGILGLDPWVQTGFIATVNVWRVQNFLEVGDVQGRSGGLALAVMLDSAS